MRVTHRRRWLQHSSIIVIAGVVVLNGLAWMHARALTHFGTADAPLPKIEAMSLAAKARAVLTGVTLPRPRNLHNPADLGLAFETRTIAIGSDAMLEAWFVPRPQPRGIVALFHSYAASKASLLHPAKAFHDLGYSTLLVDFRGSGGSSGSDTTLGMREADDVTATMRYIEQHWPQQRIILYGVSMGSSAILRAVAHNNVQPAAIILESPFDRLLHTTQHRVAAMGLPTFPTTELLLGWGSVQQGFNAFAHNPVADAPAVHSPALLLYGAHDPRVTEAETRAVFDQLGGPKTLVRIDAGHELLLLAAPERWQQHVTQFLVSGSKF